MSRRLNRLLENQLATLEPLEADEAGLRVDATLSIEDLILEIAARLPRQMHRPVR